MKHVGNSFSNNVSGLIHCTRMYWACVLSNFSGGISSAHDQHAREGYKCIKSNML